MIVPNTRLNLLQFQQSIGAGRKVSTGKAAICDFFHKVASLCLSPSMAGTYVRHVATLSGGPFLAFLEDSNYARCSGNGGIYR